MPTVDHRGATLHYEQHGNLASARPAVVFAHGSGGNALSWWQQIPAFAEHRRVVAFDHRGFGRSTCEADALDPARFAGDVAAILDDAGVSRAVLVCQSMGGWTGVAFAVAHPERIAGLVLAGTPGGIATPLVQRDTAGLPQRMAARGFLGMALGDAFRERDPALSFLFAQIGALNPPATLGTVLPKLAGMRADPASLCIPVLVIAGTDDAFFSVEALREVAASIPAARCAVIEGAGHSTYFERPAAFNAAVAAFLEEI